MAFMMPGLRCDRSQWRAIVTISDRHRNISIIVRETQVCILCRLTVAGRPLPMDKVKQSVFGRRCGRTKAGANAGPVFIKRFGAEGQNDSRQDPRANRQLETGNH
jgi:hypothetical protein